MSGPTLYGHRLSQPVRVVEWYLKLNEIPYTFQNINLAKGENRTPEFLAMNPSHSIPVLKDTDGTVVTESNAIVYYLCEKYGDKRNLFPVSGDLKIRVRIAEFLSWYPVNLRAKLAGFIFPVIAVPTFFKGAAPSPSTQAKLYEAVHEAVRAMNDNWLRNGLIARPREPTIADLQAYSELQHLAQFAHFDFTPYKNV